MGKCRKRDAGQQSLIQNKRKKKDSKELRVLKALAEGWKGNRFQAARQLHDWCLHSTVSTIQQKYGLLINRVSEVVPGHNGTPTRVCKYWMSHETRAKAEQLVSTLAKF